MLNWQGRQAGLAAGFADLISGVVDQLPYQYVAQQGYRSNAEQDAAFSLGRDAYGNIVNPSAVVTNARGGESPHNAGLAVDLYPIVNGVVDYGFYQGQSEPSPDALPAWQALWDAIDASSQLNSGRWFQLASGYDPGHIELSNWKVYSGAPIVPDATATGGLFSPGTAGGMTSVVVVIAAALAWVLFQRRG
jgi:hypothetical protein